MIESLKEKAKPSIRRREGYRNYVYKCSKGYNSIGYGFNVDANPLPGDIRVYLQKHGVILPEMAERLLDICVSSAIRACERLYPEFHTFSERRQLALLDLAYNMGETRLRKFTNTNHAINRGEWELAANGIKRSLYWTQLGGDPPGTDDGKLERPEEIAQMIREG